MNVKKALGLFVFFFAVLMIGFAARTFASTTIVNDNDKIGDDYVLNYVNEEAWKDDPDPSNKKYMYMDEVKYSNTPDSYVEYQFTGTSISFLSAIGPNMGIAKIYLDCNESNYTNCPPETVETVDLYNPILSYHVAPFVKSGLTEGTHTIRVVVTGNKNSAACEDEDIPICGKVVVDNFTARTTNLALDTNVIASSSSLEDYGWGEDNLVDGKYTEYSGSTPVSLGWTSQSQWTVDHEEWVEIDLGTTNIIDRIDLFPRSGGVYFPKAFKIEVSNGLKDPMVSTTDLLWTKVVERTDYAQPNDSAQSFRIGAQSVRYIRITGTELRQFAGENDFYRMQLTEVEVYFDDYQHQATQEADVSATYYISSTTGSDSNDGKTSATAWRTLTKASDYTYKPDNQILLKSGDIWKDETLFLHGNGIEDHPIIVSSYGNGAKPHIKAGHGALYGIKVMDAHGYEISNLEFSDSISGIAVISDEKIKEDMNAFVTHNYFKVDNCDFHDMDGPVTREDFIMPYPDAHYGTAIEFVSYADAPIGDKTVYQNITLTNNTFNKVDQGITTIMFDKPLQLDGWPTNSWFFTRATYRNVNITDSHISQTYRGDGIALYGVTGGTIYNCVIDETGYEKGMWWGTAAIVLAFDEDYTVQYSELKNTKRTYVNKDGYTQPDGEGIDLESGNKHVTIFNSYIHNNEGPAMLFYGESGGWRGKNEDILVDSIFAYDNGTEGAGWDSKLIKNYPNNEGIVKNSVFKQKFEDQAYSSAPVVFDDSNYAIKPDWTQSWGPGRTKWALGKSVTSSSDVDGYGWSNAAAVDGITSSSAGVGSANGWSSYSDATHNHVEWLQIDLGSPISVGEVDLWASNLDTVCFPVDFKIEVSLDGTNWTTVHSETGYAQPSVANPKQAFTFTEQMARYVRITGTSLRPNPNENNYYRMQFAEVDVLQLF